MLRICIRREAKNAWEKRAPLTPEAVAKLIANGLEIWVESCAVRVFPDSDYQAAGAKIVDDGSQAELILGIKEPSIESIKKSQVHVAFSHTIKGQYYNMGMLQAFLDLQATLIDYETMRDEKGVRVIAFGRYAGIAGAVDSFHLFGRKLELAGKETTFSKVGMTHTYRTVARLKDALTKLQPVQGEPVQVLIVGKGKVGKGCIEVCEWLGLKRISAEEVRLGKAPAASWYALATSKDIYSHLEGKPYDRDEFREFGSDRYRSCFDQYLGKFNVLLQTNYWETHYPYQLPEEMLSEHKNHLPWVIGDISCDIEGSLACTLEATTIDEPGKTYLPEVHELVEGISWKGPTLMSIDHLPCELSEDATNDFSRILEALVPMIAEIDLGATLEQSGMSRLIQEATIVYDGKLTEPYQYLEDFLD